MPGINQTEMYFSKKKKPELEMLSCYLLAFANFLKPYFVVTLRDDLRSFCLYVLDDFI